MELLSVMCLLGWAIRPPVDVGVLVGVGVVVGEVVGEVRLWMSRGHVLLPLHNNNACM